MNSKNTARYVSIFIVGCIVLGLIITLSQSKNQTLSSYVDDSNSIITTVAPYEAKEELPDMQTITDTTIGLAVDVPMNWTRVIRNGYVTYIDPNTTAYVQIQKNGYSPSIHNITESSIQTDIASCGDHFVSFTPNNNYGYTLLYQHISDGVLYDYIEVTRYDLQNLARIVICTPDEIYQQLLKELSLIVDSVSWNPPNPVPSDFELVYNAFGNFEFAVPVAWEKYIDSGDYVARDYETGAEMRVTVYESNATYDSLNQGNFTEYMASGKDGFTIKQFTSNRNLIYCVSSYSINGISVYRVDYMLATGAYEYSISFVCPVESYESRAGLFEQAFSLFRTF